ncbi:hypothetical protein KAJ38_01590 [Candidatus Pacearchaeota archaeon]|nr:hypothetical protein [Candidatus Pacearchaeota archaeon]
MLRKKTFWEKIANQLIKTASKTETQKAEEITRRTYHENGNHQGVLDTSYTSNEIKALREIQKITGAAKRIGELEKIINHQKAIIKTTREESKKFLEVQERQWQEFYNTERYNKIGIISLSPDTRIINQNKRIKEYFGDMMKTPIDFSMIYNFKKVGKQRIKILGEDYIMEPISRRYTGADTTYKIYKAGFFSELKAKREEAEKRNKKLLENIKKDMALEEANLEGKIQSKK